MKRFDPRHDPGRPGRPVFQHASGCAPALREQVTARAKPKRLEQRLEASVRAPIFQLISSSPVSMDSPPVDLEKLVLAAQEGSEAALEALICHYRDRIGGFVYALVGGDDALEDICHTIFLKMICSLARLKSAPSFESWLFRIARNACNDFLRRKWFRRIFVPFESKHEQIPAPAAAGDHCLEEFQKVLASMPSAQRELILLIAEREWSYEELAQITGSSISAVKSRLFRAREFIRGKLGDGA